MQFKSVFLILSGLLIFQSGVISKLAFAKELGKPPTAIEQAPYCTKNKTDYMARVNQLPEVLKGIDEQPDGKMYHLTGVKGLFANAAIKLRINSKGKIIFDLAVASPTDLFYGAEVPISQICFDGDTVKIDLENKKSFTATINDSSSFELKDSIGKGGTFKPITEAEYAQEVEAVKAKIADKNSSTTAPAAAPAAASIRRSGKQ